MNLLWKSGVSLCQINDRVRKGVSKIELHLFANDLENLDKIEENLNSVRDKVEIVHTPISDKYNIEALNSSENKEIIYKTCELAQRLSNEERLIDVVIHQTLSLDRLKIWGLYDVIVSELRYILNKYPNIILNLENLTIIGSADLDKKEEKDYKYCRDSYFKETLNLCVELRQDLQTDRIGLVWDVCHGVSSNRLMKSLIEVGYIEEISEEIYLKTYLPYLNIIHLSNTKELGYGHGNHGTTFDTEEELKALEHLIKLILNYNYKGKITLEVWESDYTDVKNCVVLDKQVREILQHIS